MLQATLWGSYGLLPVRSMPKKPSLGKLELLDDSAPAGPYQHRIDDCALRLLCLAIIDQAMRDDRNDHESAYSARYWLQETGSVWLRALRVQRGMGDGRARFVFGPVSNPSILDTETCDRFMPEDR